MNKKSKILITGSSGMVGFSILNYLKKNNYTNLYFPQRRELDLTNKSQVLKYLSKVKPDFVFACAAYVGGIEANIKESYKFFINNLEIQNNLITSCHQNNIKNFAFFGSSCIYPKFANQPIREEELLSGYLEKTNEAYAVAKIAGLKMCEYLRTKYKRNYFTIMPSNVYGENDNYNPNKSHVIPALIYKIHKAKKNNQKVIKLFGTGNAKREFIFSEDLAKASIKAMQKNKNYSMINIGSGSEITIKKLANIILKISKYDAKFIFQNDIPDGTPRKILDSSKIHKLGWTPETKLIDGLKYVYNMYENNINIRI